MKKLPKLLLAILLVLSLSLSICACDVIDNIFGKDCESHVDADKDGKCDECEAPVETQPECTHSDKNDDGKCDECTADFTDGCDNHVDLDDNGVCDVTGCNEACIDGCDNHVDLDDNGVCDVTGCDEAYTDGCNNHVDANLDHVCDSNGCSVVIGTCADADLDHNCDYGCSKVWGDHADADLDHNCDYGCSVAIGDHADADLDHDCDYGCSVAIGNHADADLDHDCDYGCNVAIGVHADADLDHDCDYGCSVAFGTCEDADKDHACDYGCDATFGTEEDKDDDRKCDYCGEAFEDGCDAQHRDADDDGKCDFGGEDFEDGAEPIVLKEDVEVMGTAKSVGQELIYKLTASTTGAYGIEFWGSYFDINVYCEDTSTQAIYTKTGIISSHNDTVSLEEGEVYYFVLTYQENFESYVYLTVSAPEAEEPEASENGESFNTAFTLEDGVSVTGNATYSKNTLYYRLNVTATGEYRIVVNGASFYVLSLYSADNTSEAIKTWDKSGAYNGNIEELVDLVSGKTYYFVFEDNYGYGYKLTASYRPECTAHADANDDAKCDVCGDAYTDGCDLKDCLDINNDGLCDNANCDEATENKAEGSTFDNAIDLALDTATAANITLSGQKIYFKFTATSDWYNIKVSGYYSTIAIYDVNDTTNSKFNASGSSGAVNKLFEITEGNEYYLVIGSTSTYNYTVTLSTASDPFGSATELVPSEAAQNITFGANQTIYFMYTAAQTGDYRLMTDSSYYWANNEVTIYDSNKEIISGPILGTSYKVDTTVTMTAGETYYITITYLGNYSTDVKVTFTAPAAGDTEPEEPVADGTSFEKAYELVPDDETTKVTFSPDQYIYYVYTATETANYAIYISSGWNYAKVTVYNADQTVFAGPFSDNMGKIDTTVALTADTTYYFVVTMPWLYGTGTIDFKFSGPIAADPECTEHVDEKNNDTDVAEADGKCDVCGEDMPTVEPEEPAAGSSFETAIELVEGVAATAEVTAVGQKFYYKLTASATGTYDVECWGYVNINVYKADDLATHFDTLAHMYGSIFGSLDLVEGTTYYFEVTTTESYGSVELTLTAPAAE